MSEELKNIFDDFDPGVSDEQLEQRWQAIRPLLPADEKPKGIILFNRRSVRLLGIAASVVLVSFISVLFLRKTTPDATSKTVTQESPVGKSANTPFQDADSKPGPVDQKVRAKASSPENIEDRPHSGTGKVRSSVALTRRHDNQDKSGEDEQQRITAVTTNNPEDYHPGSAGFTPEEKPGEVLHAEEQPISSDSTVNEKTAFLPPAQYTPEVTEREAVATVSEVRRKPLGPGGKWAVELFGGVDRYNNSYRNSPGAGLLTATKADSEGSPQFATGFTWVAGASAHRSIGRRVFLPMQVIYTGPQDVMTEVKRGSFKVTGPVVTAQADSNVTYQGFTEVLEIRQQKSVRFALGLGTRLFATPMFTLNAMVLGELRQTSYLRTNTVTFDQAETVSYPSQTHQQYSGYVSNTAGYEPNSSTSYKKNIYGAVATLHAARSVGNRLAITTRLSYHYAFQKTELPGRNQNVDFRPRDLLLCLGLNYRW